ncbi:type I restriction-modification system subunit M [[Mycoplasma] anseris]|uniref:site-specific DNA-methyltransferase (adenine-specific) n=1 Tax=[Mycoplasma] anseris TaxID=92400 RepID=A0A2Z4NDI7_9BACT|nr:type I restriction-modification system subunit M [[Mycoplasma] anseris]AWX69653.1 type I restriction-modification system subunit M [[Mycoplasma] anseris]
MNKESNQRAELHRKIWAIADEVRGAVDGWDFKQYILGILFYRYISENLCQYFNEAEKEAGNDSFDYAIYPDEDAIRDFKNEAIKIKGFFILPSQLFQNITTNALTNENLNTDLDTIFKAIENSAIGHESEDDIKGLFADIDVTSSRLGGTVKERNLRLAKILNGINDINFGNFQENEIDAFGDAYEFLISNYASNAGKSGGEFFTPQTVSKLLARIVMDNKTKINKVYDPTCGSGSLLLQMKKQFDQRIIEEGFFGQEINMTNYNLARMNMFLHNVNYNNFSIKRGDTLIHPLHKDQKPFDAIVSNPPYSVKWVGDDDPTLLNDERFAPAGRLAPKSKADFAFILHSLNHLSSSGRAAIVCFPGIFYRKGAEKAICEYLINHNFIDCIIQLPGNLFFGTSIATCILVMSKNKTENKVLFIDASKEFKKETNNNILTEENIEKIIKEFRERKEIQYFSRYVDKEEIAKNDYNLSVSSYIQKEDTKEKIDIMVLNKEIKETVKRINELRQAIDDIVKELENE